MRVRPIDQNGDMMPVTDADQMLEGNAAVAQIARDRLMIYKGDWWEDEEFGLYIPQLFVNKASRENVYFIEKLLTNYLSRTEGVTAVSNASATIKGHALHYKAVLRTAEGIETVEVDMSGLL